MGDLATIHSGLPLEEALVAFRRCCNTGPDRLFVTDGWLAPHLATIRRYISGPITEDQAHVLRGAAEKRESLERMGEWLSEHGGLTWVEFKTLLARRQAEGEAAKAADFIPSLRRRYEKWRSCPEPIPSGHPDLPPIFPTWRIRDANPDRIAAAQQEHAERMIHCPSCGTDWHSLRWREASYKAFAPTVLAGRGWDGWIVSCEKCCLGISEIHERWRVS